MPTPAAIRGSRLAVEIAARSRLDRSSAVVEGGALLHDVGKSAITKEIIRKPGPWDELECRDQTPR